MYRFMQFSAVVITIIVMGCAVAPPPKSVDCFAKGNFRKGVPVGWKGSSSAPEKYSIGVDRAIAYDGDVSFTFMSRKAGSENVVSLFQSIEAGQYAGQRVRFQAYVKTCNVNSSTAIWMRADSKEEGCVAFDNMLRRGDMPGRRISGTTDWKRYHIVLNVPRETVALTYGTMLEGSGRVWIDACSLEIVSKEVQITSRNMGRSFEKRYVKPLGILKYPANMGYEGRPNKNDSQN